jgi:hypothetical protein
VALPAAGRREGFPRLVALARAIWGRVVPAHKRVVSSLLTQAARREAASWPAVW